MDQVRFGIVGLGMGHNRARTITKTEGAQVTAVCDLDEARCRKTAEATGCEWTTEYSELLARKDVDVVFVMTPSGMHADFGVQAAQAGKHVVTTKPIDVTLEAADRLIRACREAGVMLAVDFEYRYLASVAMVKMALDQGLFGRPLLGEVSLRWYRPQSYYDVGWRGTWKHDGGGALINQTVHDIDVLLWWLGRPKRVIGHTSTNAHTMETEDLGMAIVEFESGAKGSILGTTTYPIDRPVEKQVHGEKLGARIVGTQLEWYHAADATPPELAYDGPRHIVEDVVGALKEGRDPVVTGEEGRRSLELIRTIYEAAGRGSAVAFPAQ